MLVYSILDNGLGVVTEAVEGAASVTAGFWVGTGGRDETPDELGASHFLEHLLFKGTPSRSATDIARSIDAVGGDMNAFTTKEYTAFYVRVLGEDADLALDVLSDIIWSPALRPGDVEAERAVILEEILMHSDEPADVASETVYSALFPDHPLGRDVLGTTETITNMAPVTIQDFFHRHYLPSNMVFSAAGAVDHDKVISVLQERLGSRPGKAPLVRSAPLAPAVPFSLVRRPSEQAHLLVAMAAPARPDGRRYVVDVLDHVLGGGMSSRLFQEVRERRGLAYSVYSDVATYHDAGVLTVYAGTAPQRASEVVSVLHGELDRLAEDGCTPEELETAKGHLRASLLLALEDPGARMSRIGRSQLLHGRVFSLEEILQGVDAVELSDVAALAAEVLGGPRSVVAAGPFGDSSLDVDPGLVTSGEPA